MNAAPAQAEELHRMVVEAESRSLPEGLREPIDRFARDVFHLPAAAADRVVVVRALARQVPGLASFVEADRDLPHLAQALQRAIDGREGDALAFRLQQGVQFGCREVSPLAAQRLGDQPARPGRVLTAYHRHEGLVASLSGSRGLHV